MARAGDVLEEPGERIEFLATSADTDGESVRCRMRVAPGRPVPPEHSHPNQEESFTIESGRLGYILGARRLEATAGDVVVVEPGMNHTFWNAGESELTVVGDIRPALRFEDFVETIHGLIRDGRIPAGGRRGNPLQLAVVAHAYRREWRLTKMPAAARALLPVLAAIGRAAGYTSHHSADRESRKSEAAANV